MNGIRKIFAWYEIWINDECVETIRVPYPFATNDLTTKRKAEHRYVQLTDGRLPRYVN